MNLQSHVFSGRMARAPHIIQKDGQQKLALFTVIHNTVYKDRTTGENKVIVTGYPCQAWGKVADLVEKYCGKGKTVGITADFRNTQERDAQGNFVKSHPTFRVRRIDFGPDSKATRDLQSQTPAGTSEIPANFSAEQIQAMITQLEGSIAAAQ